MEDQGLVKTDLGGGWYMFSRPDIDVTGGWQAWAVPYEDCADNVEEEFKALADKLDGSEFNIALPIYFDFGWDREMTELKVRVLVKQDERGFKNAKQS